MEGRPVEAIIMPIALRWSALEANRAGKAWPAPALFEHFAAILRNKARNLAAA